MTADRYAHFVLRVGAAFAFLYPPFAALSDPTSWAAYFPSFVRSFPIGETVLLQGFGVVEVALALWLLFGRRIRIPAALMTLILLLIVAVNLSQFDVVFRDLAIAAMTLALALSPETA